MFVLHLKYMFLRIFFFKKKEMFNLIKSLKKKEKKYKIFTLLFKKHLHSSHHFFNSASYSDLHSFPTKLLSKSEKLFKTDIYNSGDASLKKKFKIILKRFKYKYNVKKSSK